MDRYVIASNPVSNKYAVIDTSGSGVWVVIAECDSATEANLVAAALNA